MEATMGRLSAIAMFVALSACGASEHERERERGEAFFAGATPVVARMAGHDEVLPGSASRCANCHGFVRASSPSSAPTFGPTLSARFLRDARSRRGGPASRFDAASLCRMLRTGVDPASIIIARSMPLYEFSDRDCAALWTYLSSD